MDWNLWKENHIDSIINNENNHTEYLAITADFYHTKQLQYMNLSQINDMQQEQTELVGVNQIYW